MMFTPTPFLSRKRILYLCFCKGKTRRCERVKQTAASFYPQQQQKQMTTIPEQCRLSLYTLIVKRMRILFPKQCSFALQVNKLYHERIFSFQGFMKDTSRARSRTFDVADLNGECCGVAVIYRNTHLFMARCIYLWQDGI